MICLPDVNVWIALAAERHIFHPVARLWFGTLKEDKLAFCRVLTEPAGLSETWRGFTPKQAESPNLWTDAYLCAFAAAGQLTLATFDANIPPRADVSRILLPSTR
jgi:predicted nucleic acid-binding protein